MIDKGNLLPWREQIDSQLTVVRGMPRVALENWIPRGNRQKFRDLLSGETHLFGSQLEKRIDSFIMSGTWGDLSDPHNLFYLERRLELARQVLESWIVNAGDVPTGFPAPPSPNSPAEFWRWLLIAVWDTPLAETTLGEHFLMQWLDRLIVEVQSLQIDHPLKMLLEWFDEQGKNVRGQVVLYSRGMLPQQSRFSTPPKSPLEALQQCAEFAEDIAKSEETFRAWLTTEPQRDGLRQLGKVLFVRSAVSFLIFKYGHDEGREAVQALRDKDAELFGVPRGDPAQESAEWTAASHSWKPLCATSLSDEALEAWVVRAL